MGLLLEGIKNIPSESSKFPFVLGGLEEVPQGQPL